MTLTLTLPRTLPDTFSHDPWLPKFQSEVNTRLEKESPWAILLWALETFGGGLTVGTSFGASGMVLIDMALQLRRSVDIFYIDTGFFFPETLALIERVESYYGRSFRRVTPDLSVEEQDRQFGPELYGRNPDRCCHLRKVKPLTTALAERTAWVTALRRDQSQTRAHTPIVQWNERHSLIKVAPLANWTETDVWGYIERYGVPYNGLHDQGYPSIGCWPCTRPVQPGEDLRAGRWSGQAKTECGLHWVI